MGKYLSFLQIDAKHNFCSAEDMKHTRQTYYKSQGFTISDILNVTANHKQTLENYSDCHCAGNVGYIENIQHYR